MKTLKILFVCFLPLLFLSNCKEGPQGPAGPPGEDPTDPNVAPRVVWVWLDTPRPYCRFCGFSTLQNDSLPIGYVPGRLLIRFNKIMLSYTVIPNVSLLPSEDGFAYLYTYGAISIDGQTFEFPIYNFFKVAKLYTITIGKEAMDVTNRKLENDYQKILIPEPVLRITNTYPRPNDTTVWKSSSFSVYFNSPIDTNTFKNNVSISPHVDGKWSFNQYYLYESYFYPDTGYAANTWYQISFTTGLRDTLYNYLTSPVTIRFKTTSFTASKKYIGNSH